MGLELTTSIQEKDHGAATDEVLIIRRETENKTKNILMQP